ncbi:hypothetical protein ACFQ1S_37325, partial [Kibdelosporangium lantanae]
RFGSPFWVRESTVEMPADLPRIKLGDIPEVSQHTPGELHEFVLEGEDLDYAERFAFGLECLLDGIAVRLERMR